MPVMNNEGNALIDFQQNYQDILRKAYGIEDLDEAQISSLVAELQEIEEARLAGRTKETRELSMIEKDLLSSWEKGVSKEQNNRMIQKLSLEDLERATMLTFDRINSLDLTSYTDWRKDPDCNYQSKL